MGPSEMDFLLFLFCVLPFCASYPGRVCLLTACGTLTLPGSLCFSVTRDTGEFPSTSAVQLVVNLASARYHPKPPDVPPPSLLGFKPPFGRAYRASARFESFSISSFKTRFHTFVFRSPTSPIVFFSCGAPSLSRNFQRRRNFAARLEIGFPSAVQMVR